jgi:protein NrfC
LSQQGRLKGGDTWKGINVKG